MSKDATSPTTNPKSSQWRLSTLFVLMFGFAVLFGGIANLRSAVDMKVSFQSLAPNDDRLEAWLKNRYRVSKLSIQRPNEQTLNLRFSRAFYAVEIPNPPWRELGYGPLSSFVFAQGLSGIWPIPVGLFIILCAAWISRQIHGILLWFSRPNRAPTQSATVADG